VAIVAVLLAAGGLGYRLLRNTKAAPRPAAASGSEQSQDQSGAAKIVAGEVGPAGPTAAWVKAENAKPGTAAWRAVNVAMNGEVEGFASSASIAPGQAFTLYVSTIAPAFHVEAYRMGYYQGLGGRLVWSSPETPGVRQVKPAVTYGTNMVVAHWAPSLTVQTDSSWPEGDYLLKLVSSTGMQSYVPITLRNDNSTATYVVMNAVTTWQAYNLWGGYDLYEGIGVRTSDFNHRARIVSFDRPYKIGFGSGDFLGNEQPFVSLVESLGLDVTYVTSVDVDERPTLLLHHKAVFSMGHDEYYSLSMRQGMETARDSGVNLAFMGANAVYRHIRFAPSSNGPDREEIDYKSAAEDPLYGHDNADVTVDWRDPPNNDPESKLIGDYYQCNPVKADMVVADASNWLFAGTGLQNGQHLADVVGSEYDRYDPNAPGPTNVEVLTHSPLTCQGKADHSDATYYSAPSGAGVFASGTIAWIAHLDPTCPATTCAGPSLIRITQNLLAAFGAGPAGLAHPSVANIASVREGAVGTSETTSGYGQGGTRSTTPGSGSRYPVYTPTTHSYYRPPATRAVTPSTSPTPTVPVLPPLPRVTPGPATTSGRAGLS
jgi:hypothetical protein